jgi:hypothetical protein
MANNATLYSYCSTFNVGCPVWTTPDRTVVANPGIYAAFDYSTQGTRYITVANGVISSINNLCPIGPGSVIATLSYYTPGFGELPENAGSGIIEVSRGENSTTMTPFHTVYREWIDVKSSANGTIITAIRSLAIPEANGRVERSIDSGTTFTNNATGISNSHTPVGLAVDDTAATTIVITANGYIYYTYNPYVNDYLPASIPGIRNWKAVAISSTGNIVIAAAADGTVWRSTRTQLHSTWTQSNVGGGSKSWTCITMNASGSVIWLAGNNTDLYLSTDGGLVFVQVPITVTIPNIGNISSPFNFSNIATDNLGNNTVATVEPSSNSANLSFIAKNFIGGSVNYNNWSWGWGYTGYYPYNGMPNGNWTGLAVSSNAFTVYAVNNHPSQGGLYVSQDSASTFYYTGGVKPYTSISYIRNQTCPSNGTLLTQYCEGTVLISIYANGSCGTYATTEYNSPSCQPLECNAYSVSDFGYVSYVDCNGDDQFIYYSPGDFFCARTFNYGPAYLYALGCDVGPGGGIA